MLRSIAHQDIDELGGRWSVLARQKSDHVKLDALLEELEGATGAAQGRVLLRIYRLVFPHAFAEESVLWPVMRRALPDGHELTLQVEREHQEVNELVRRTAPTRAHPVVARRPPGNVIAALPLSVLDRARDLVDGAVLRGPDQSTLGLRRLSTALAGLTHRVERLPAMRRGEDPSTARSGAQLAGAG